MYIPHFPFFSGPYLNFAIYNQVMYLRLTFAKFLSKNDCFQGGAGILTSTGFGDFSEIHSEINRKLRKHLFLLLFLQFLGVLWESIGQPISVNVTMFFSVTTTKQLVEQIITQILILYIFWLRNILEIIHPQFF